MLHVRLLRMDAFHCDQGPVTDGSKGGGVLVKVDSLKIGPAGCSVNVSTVTGRLFPRSSRAGIVRCVRRPSNAH